MNNLARARWFPAGRRRALIVLPQWNADAEGHNGLCWIFNRLGISVLRLSLPYHDYRKPAETERADYAVSANIGRWQFRYRGSRHESAVAQLFSLGIKIGLRRF